MEVFYEGKNKIKKKQLGHDVFQHNFVAELDDGGDNIPFHIIEPSPYQVYLDVNCFTAKGLILLGTAIFEAQEFIKQEMLKNMDIKY